MVRTTKVRIFGMEYSFKGVESPEYVEKLASYVDGKMREISENSSLVSTVKIAVLAALRITDELHQERKAQGLPLLSPEDRIKGLIDIIDKEVE
jgi:cell division protein ZapA